MIYLFDHLGVNWASDTIKCALFNTSFTPNINTQTYFSDISSFQCSGTGYTSGGVTLGTKSATISNGVLTLSSPDVTFSAITISNIKWAVIYKSTGTASTSVLIQAIDLSELDGYSPAIAGGDLTLDWRTQGLMKIS